ncbi:acyl-CoA dehydrogenase family protein [Streptomyces sp. NPDC000410]|uniref:acyl-CoA dehydrogenase family protein n=1 Tax=Streptomyces sp. NPDC000410 TaxID=3154254 RepID=UPI0033261EA9
MSTAIAPAATLRTAVEQAARYAADGERARSLHPDVVTALTEAGFPALFVPAGRGGAAGRFADALEMIASVGEACASAAWCAALQAAHGRLAAHLPEAGQADLWRDGPDVSVSAAVVPPAGTLAPAPGGYRLSGRWNLASGVDHARWVLLATLDPAGGAGCQRILAVPREDVRVDDNWNNSGLRATGSHSLTVDDVFVPEHRTMLRDILVTGRREDAGAARCHRIPFPLVASLLFAAPALGAARGALRSWTELTLTRVGADGRPALQDATAQQVLARSSAEIDAAQLLLERAAHRADDAPLDDLPVAANQRDAAVALDMLVGAVERLFRSAGARAQSDDCALQRMWRDIHAVAGHAAVQIAPAAAAYASRLLARHEAD